MKIQFKKLNKDAQIPIKGSKGAAAFDLVTIESGNVTHRHCSQFKTGLAVAIPEGYYGLIWPRSGLGFKQTVQVLAGCIDSDYRGEIIVGLTKHDDDVYTFINKGDRIAQLLVMKNNEVEFEEVSDLGVTKRGEAGFGSTGLTVEQALENL